MKRWLIALVLVGTFSAASAQEKAAPAEKAPAAATEAPEKLPSPREIMDRYVEAAGGKEAFLKKKSVMIKGRTEVAGKDLGGSMMLATARPNKLLLSVDLGGIKMRSGFDGKVGWQLNPLTGHSLMEEGE